jgi:hypothetical protein
MDVNSKLKEIVLEYLEKDYANVLNAESQWEMIKEVS